ncbi:MAG: hypothetical protein ACRELY_31765 [Polyangiaceae bacterium]
MHVLRASLAVTFGLLTACGGAPSPAPQAAHADPAPSASITQAEAPPPSDPPVAKSVGRPHMIPGTSIEFQGGDGSSQKQAVLIHGAHGENDGVAAEYKYLEMVYGAEGERWNRREQSLLEDNGRSYDELDFTLDGKNATIYFDITEYFGKY